MSGIRDHGEVNPRTTSTLLSAVLVFALFAGCGSTGFSGDADTDPCVSHIDTDGDTIADSDEEIGESIGRDDDADTIPNYLDLDSDDDTIPDAIEAGDDDLCTPPVNTDEESDPCAFPNGDRYPDFLDLDSDGDGLSDHDETHIHGSEPGDWDTDGDIAPDLIEVREGSDPLDPSSRPPYDFYIGMEYMAHEHTILEVDHSFEGLDIMDVSAVAEDVLGDPPEMAFEFDSSLFFKDVAPLSGQPGASEGYASLGGTTFYSVVPGTRLTFRVDMFNNIIPPMDEFQVLKAGIGIYGDTETLLHWFSFVFIVSAPSDWCDYP